MKSSISNEDIKQKLSEEDLSTVQKCVSETEEWLDSDNDKTKDEYDTKLTEMNGLLNPIMMKVYGQGEMPMDSSVPSGLHEPTSNEPTIDEID